MDRIRARIVEKRSDFPAGKRASLDLRIGRQGLRCEAVARVYNFPDMTHRFGFGDTTHPASSCDDALKPEGPGVVIQQNAPSVSCRRRRSRQCAGWSVRKKAEHLQCRSALASMVDRLCP